MSIKAVTWALKDAPVPDPLSHLILIGLSDHTTDDGTGAWPSVKKLAEYARCSERTVHGRLRVLEDQGLIARGDQELVSHLPKNRRPVVYDVTFGVQEMHPSRGAGDAGVNDGVSSGVHAAADKPSISPNGENPSPTSSGIEREDVEQVCEAVALHAEHQTGKRPSITAKWRTEARLLLDRDGHDLSEVASVLRWVWGHSFWGANILSAPKLREKFPTLVAQMRRDGQRGDGRQRVSIQSQAAALRFYDEEPA